MNEDSLSESGLQRRTQILHMAQKIAKRRRLRRVLSRCSAGIAVLLVASLILVRMQLSSSVPIARSLVVQSAIVSPASPAVSPDYIQTDPAITDQLTLPRVVPRWTSISDEELTTELTAAGQAVGIVCINGKTILLRR